MAHQFNHLPHIQSTEAGRDFYDPMHQSIFEVYFDIPAGLKGTFTQEDFDILTEQVIDVSGLDSLQKTTGAGQQKFLGVDVSFLNPTLDNTYCEFTVNFNLNLRNHNDAYVLKLFRAWGALGYDLTTGTRNLMADYVSDSVHIAEANRDGTVWRIVNFRKVMLIEITGLDALNYTTNDARTLSCKFRADWWIEQLAGRDEFEPNDMYADAKK